LNQRNRLLQGATE